MHPSDEQGRKLPKEEPRRSDAPVVVPFKPRATPRRPSREPDDPGPDTAA